MARIQNSQVGHRIRLLQKFTTRPRLTWQGTQSIPDASCNRLLNGLKVVAEVQDLLAVILDQRDAVVHSDGKLPLPQKDSGASVETGKQARRSRVIEHLESANFRKKNSFTNQKQKQLPVCCDHLPWQGKIHPREKKTLVAPNKIQPASV